MKAAIDANGERKYHHSMADSEHPLGSIVEGFYMLGEEQRRNAARRVRASATGSQLTAEIHRFGCPVTLAVGEHIRAPRMSRGAISSGGWMRVAYLTRANAALTKRIVQFGQQILHIFHTDRESNQRVADPQLSADLCGQ